MGIIEDLKTKQAGLATKEETKDLKMKLRGTLLALQTVTEIALDYAFEEAQEEVDKEQEGG